MEYIFWPIVVLIIVLVFIFVFKKQIASLIAGIHRIDLPGVKASTNQEPVNLTEKNKTSEKLLKVFDNQLLVEQENKITDAMELKDITDDKEKVKILTKYLASSTLTLIFEQIYNSIWGSQIKLLENINAKFNGEEKGLLKRYYDLYIDRLFGVEVSYTYDNYLNFLVSYELITIKDEMVYITQKGRGFLSYIIMTGKSMERFF